MTKEDWNKEGRRRRRTGRAGENLGWPWQVLGDCSLKELNYYHIDHQQY
jgi:hypothetical protein